ncbi:sensor histidine kinase [Owenweeksia hongkongensis]|uniref:sensor histidine kinase n=1 Tax=Owenweeksia hongkongensis TaxID=253245 RepID=UPI003A939FCF
MDNLFDPKSTVVYKIAILTCILLVLQTIIGLFLGYPPLIFAYFAFVFATMGIVTLLLKRQKETSAKIFFLSSAYFNIFLLTPIFGYELNTHLSLIPGVGMALIFFDKEIGNRKWFFVFAGFPVWLAIEIWAKKWPVVVNISPTIQEQMGLVNIAFTMITSFFMYYVFTQRSNKQLAEIREERKHAENSVNRLTQFSYVLTHDLKSPLATISSMTDLVSNDDSLSKAEIDELLFLLNKKAQSSARLIEGITEYFKTTQKQEPQWENTESIISEILSLLTLNPNFNIKIDTLPEIFLSQIAIRQLAQNMITNAHKYNDKEIGELHIFYTEDAEYGRLCFKDNGVGMNKRQQKKAFELYTLFHKMAESQSSGMGLAIAKELVESNDGFIELSSEVGVGTQFNLCFSKKKFRFTKN